MNNIILGILFTMLVSFCSSEKKKPIYVDSEEIAETDSIAIACAHSGDEIIVPFRQESGVKYVKIRINGVGFDMIFDTGCSNTLISVAEANYLYQKGKLSKEDILGIVQSQIADGSIVENMVINLREIIIDDKILCPDVQATVSNNINAPLLLGNEVLNRLATITIDNENENLKFKLK